MFVGFRTNVGARVGGRPGLFTPAGYSPDDPVWASGDESTFPRWEVYRDEWGWVLTGWLDAVTYAEFRLDPPTADLDYEGPNTFELEWSNGSWLTPTTLTITLTPPGGGLVRAEAGLTPSVAAGAGLTPSVAATVVGLEVLV